MREQICVSTIMFLNLLQVKKELVFLNESALTVASLSLFRRQTLVVALSEMLCC